MVLLRSARLISASVLVGLLVSLAYLMVTPASYRARTEILVDPRAQQGLRDSENITLDSSQIETHIVELKSRNIAEQVVDAMKLADDIEFAGDRVGTELARPAAITQFIEKLTASRVGISYVIELAVQARDPGRAAQIANATAEAYLRNLVAVRSDAARESSEWLEQQTSKLRLQMNAAARRAQQAKASQDYRIVASSADAKGLTEGAAGSLQERPTLEELELVAATYRKSYEHSFNALTELVQRQSYPVSNVRVVSRAVKPDRKTHPKTVIVLGLGIMLGGAIGVALALMRQLRNQV